MFKNDKLYSTLFLGLKLLNLQPEEQQQMCQCDDQCTGYEDLWSPKCTIMDFHSHYNTSIIIVYEKQKSVLYYIYMYLKLFNYKLKRS